MPSIKGVESEEHVIGSGERTSWSMKLENSEAN